MREPDVEFKVSLGDATAQGVFTALCRRYGLEPYRHERARHSTVCVRLPATFMQQTFWPLYETLARELDSYLTGVTSRVLREVLGVDLEMSFMPGRSKAPTS